MSKARQVIEAMADAYDEGLLFADGFDDAIIGICECFNRTFVVYDHAKVIQTLMTRDGLDADDADEYYRFNILGGWHGDATPGYIIRWEDLE